MNKKQIKMKKPKILYRKNLMKNYGIKGVYDKFFNTILIDKSLKEKERKKTIEHELAHYLTDKKFGRFDHSLGMPIFRLTRYGLAHTLIEWKEIWLDFKGAIKKLVKKVD